MATGVACAQCGEPLQCSSDAYVVVCDHCGERNLVLMDEARYGVEIQQTINGKEAAATVRRELEAAGNVESAFLEAVTDASEHCLYFIPNFESRGLAVMRYCQQKYRERIISKHLNMDSSPGRRVGVVREINKKSIHYDTRISIQAFDHSTPAVKGLRWEVRAIAHEDVILRMADMASMQQRGIVLSPTLDMETFRAQKERLGTRDVETHRDVVFQDDRTLYLPVWRITTRYQGLVYDGFVCAATGVFFKATAPQSRKSRATAFGISYAVTAFITSACIVMIREIWRMGQPDLEAVVQSANALMIVLTLPVLVLIAVLAAMAAYGWDKFRYHPEVVRTQNSTMIHAVGKQGDTWLDKLHQATLENVSRTFDGAIND
ncbi:MAG TPA: hypothetical protein PLV45_00385 [bacterium]|nr:hypothetical protein [bacterium]